MGDFATIQAEIQRRVIDLPAHVSNDLGSFVNRAMRDLQVDHNFRCMKATFEAQTTVAVHALATATPSNWKAPRDAPWYTWEDTGQQTFVEWIEDDAELARLYSLTDPNDKGPPVHLFARFSQTESTVIPDIEVYPFPDGLSDWGAAPAGEYRLVIPYWKFLADLTGSASNWFTVNAEEYLISQAAGHAFMADWDEKRAAVWYQQAAVVARKPKKIDAAQSRSGRRELVPRADVYGSPRRPANRFTGSRGWRV